MNAKQARELAKDQMNRIEGAEAEVLTSIHKSIEKLIISDPEKKEIHVKFSSKRIKSALINDGYDVKEWRDRDGELYLTINWSEDGIRHLPGANATDYHAK